MRTVFHSHLRMFAAFMLLCISSTGAAIEGPSGGIQVDVVQGRTVAFDLPLSNTGTEDSEQLSLDIPDTLHWLWDANSLSSLPAGQSTTVTLLGRVPNTLPLGLNNATIFVLEAGSSTPVSIVVQMNVVPPSPTDAQIEGPAGGIQETIVRGTPFSIAVELRNVSSVASQPMSLTIPSSLPWFSLGSTNPIPSILGGQSTTVQLVGTIPVTASLQLIDATLVGYQEGSETPTLIPIEIYVSSQNTGSLEVEVQNELTFWAAGQPRVEGATVSIFESSQGELVATATTDVSGRVQFPNLVEGGYSIHTEAPNHRHNQLNVFVFSGASPLVTIFIERTAISYSSTLTPVEELETNDLTLDSQFTTTVPRPRITMSPSSIQYEDTPVDAVTTLLLNITNHGLISFSIQELSDNAPEGLTLTPLGPPVDGNTLPARSSLISPLQVEVNDANQWSEGDRVEFGMIGVSGAPNDPITHTLSFVDPSPPVLPPVTVSCDLEQSAQAQKTGTAYQFAMDISHDFGEPFTNLSFDFKIRAFLDPFGPVLNPSFIIDSVLPRPTLPAGASDTVSLLITPSANIIGARNRIFSLGGTMSYERGGVLITIDILPHSFHLEPLPRLALKHFSPLRRVSADEPFSEERVESSEPFSTASMLTNTGAGIAREVAFSSGQPAIIANPNELLFSKNQQGTIVDDNPLNQSLTSSFGDLAPGETRVSRNVFQTSLSGSLSPGAVALSVTHSNGGVVPSGDLAFESVTNHDTIQVVRDPRANGVAGPAFLTDENRDGVVLPDNVHLADGFVFPVSGPVATASGSPSFTNRSAQITLSGATSGFVYSQLPDPSGGTMSLDSISRSDGSLLDPNNFWTTRVVTSAPYEELTFDTTLHLFDHNPVGSYSLSYGNNPPEVTQIEDQVGAEQTLFTLTPEARDPDSGPPPTWSLAPGAPLAMSIHPSTGTISWTPDELTGGQTFPITLIATDAQPPFETSSTTFNLTIDEQNSPPAVLPTELDVIGGLQLTYQVQASDSDLPAQPLTYSFPSSSPSGMTLSEGGLVEWSVPDAEKEDTVVVSIAASDGTSSHAANLLLHTRPLSSLQPEAQLQFEKKGLYTLRAQDLPYHEAEVWASDDLLQWQRVFQAAPNDTGTLLYEVPVGQGTPEKRFFQLRFPTN